MTGRKKINLSGSEKRGNLKREILDASLLYVFHILRKYDKYRTFHTLPISILEDLLPFPFHNRKRSHLLSKGNNMSFCFKHAVEISTRTNFKLDKPLKLKRKHIIR